MKNLMMMMFALTGLTAFAAPSWLYFKIDQDALWTGSGDYARYAETYASFDYVTVSKVVGETVSRMTIDGSTYDTLDANAGSNGRTAGETHAAFELGTGETLDDLTFLFQLWSDGNDNSPLAYASVAFSDLTEAEKQAISTGYQPGGNQYLVVTAAVPEPTSCLLLLLGCGALALLRRKIAVED